MIVTNNTSFIVVSYIRHVSKGPGEDIEIKPGESKRVLGPRVGQMLIDFPGSVICQEKEVQRWGQKQGWIVQISKGNPVVFGNDDVDIIVRHHFDRRYP